MGRHNLDASARLLSGLAKKCSTARFRLDDTGDSEQHKNNCLLVSSQRVVLYVSECEQQMMAGSSTAQGQVADHSMSCRSTA